MAHMSQGLKGLARVSVHSQHRCTNNQLLKREICYRYTPQSPVVVIMDYTELLGGQI